MIASGEQKNQKAEAFNRFVECRRHQRWRNYRRRNLRCHRHRGRLRWLSTRRLHDYRRRHRFHHSLELCKVNRLATRRRRRLRVRAPTGFALRWVSWLVGCGWSQTRLLEQQFHLGLPII